MKRDSTDLLVVHCAATPPHVDVGVRVIRQWHLTRGFSDVGYHFVIRRDGTLEAGREVNEVGAHVAGSNRRSVGVCLVGGVDAKEHRPEFNFTRPQMDTLEALLTTLETDYPRAKVIGHRDVPGVNKACPSFDVRSWWYGETDGAP